MHPDEGRRAAPYRPPAGFGAAIYFAVKGRREKRPFTSLEYT